MALLGLALLVAIAVDAGGGADVAAPEPEPAVEAAPVRDALDRRLDCVEWYESRGYPLAYNPRSGASGLFQFLPSTWRSTPEGRAGASIWDAAAQRRMARWMFEQGRAREWTPIQRGLC